MAHHWETLINMQYYHIAVALETVDVSCLWGKQKLKCKPQQLFIDHKKKMS